MRKLTLTLSHVLDLPIIRVSHVLDLPIIRVSSTYLAACIMRVYGTHAPQHATELHPRADTLMHTHIKQASKTCKRPSTRMGLRACCVSPLASTCSLARAAACFCPAASFNAAKIALLSGFHGGGHYATVMSLGPPTITTISINYYYYIYHYATVAYLGPPSSLHHSRQPALHSFPPR